MWEGTVTSKNNLEASYKVKQVLAIRSSNPPTPGTYLREMETHVHTKTYIQTSSFIYKSSKLEITQMPISWGLDKQSMIHPYNGMPLSNTRE